MNRKQKQLVRVVAIILAVLLGFSAVISAILSFAYAEEALPQDRNACELTMEYLGEEQALRISQRLVYTNESGRRLDRVIFYAPANLLRRQDSLPYDGEALLSAFPAGYLPGGIDLASVRVNDAACDWGFQGTDEMFLRVACDLDVGQSCVFSFDYYLLLTQNAAFLGVSEDEWRLSNFYFAPASLNTDGEFILNGALGFTRYVDTPAMDFNASLLLPEKLTVSATGAEIREVRDGGVAGWRIEAENVRDFAMVIGKFSAESSASTPSGVQIRLMGNVPKNRSEILFAAQEAVELCEQWFGPLPFRQLDIVQADCGAGSMTHSACLWLDEELMKDFGWDARHAIFRFIAAQYFSCNAWARPVSDAWLADSMSEYIAYCMVDALQGHDAYLQALNTHLVPSLQLTIPGGLNVTSDAALFTDYEYDIVVKNRGAAVFHELYTAMGSEELICGLRLYYEKGRSADVLTEMDLVNALEEASGKKWEKFLTDWLFNIGDYVNQEIFWLD